MKLCKILTLLSVFLIILVIGHSTQSAHAAVVFTASGKSATDVDVTFEAQLTISSDILTVILINDSTVDSLNPDDVLGSFYFDILNSSSIRPTLTYSSAIGDTYKGVLNGADTLLGSDTDIQAFSNCCKAHISPLSAPRRQLTPAQSATAA